MQERIRNQFIRDEEARAQRHDAEELARSLLAEMAPAQRVRFMAGQMCEARGAGVLQALLDARNVITDRAKDLIAAPNFAGDPNA